MDVSRFWWIFRNFELMHIPNFKWTVLEYYCELEHYIWRHMFCTFCFEGSKFEIPRGFFKIQLRFLDLDISLSDYQ